MQARFATVPSHGLGKEISAQLATLGRIIKFFGGSQVMAPSGRGDNRVGPELDRWPEK